MLGLRAGTTSISVVAQAARGSLLRPAGFSMKNRMKKEGERRERPIRAKIQALLEFWRLRPNAPERPIAVWGRTLLGWLREKDAKQQTRAPFAANGRGSVLDKETLFIPVHKRRFLHFLKPAPMRAFGRKRSRQLWRSTSTAWRELYPSRSRREQNLPLGLI